MKKLIVIGVFSAVATQGFAQINMNDIYNKAKKTVNTATSTTKSSSPLSNDEIVKGLKEALSVGATKSGDVASKLDGFYKNPAIKIPFPSEAKQMETTLRDIGMGKQVDKLVMTLNRAAEDAAKSAVPVFKAAITGMTITDGVKILNGGNDAATSFLKKMTTAELKTKFKPIIQQSLQKVYVTQYWNPLVTAYNRVPMVTKMNPNLEEYVTQKALEGLFYLVSQEELKIRKDPAARVSDILKKVFGR